MGLLSLLFLVWIFFPASVLIGLVYGKVLARGARGGGPGFGHICDRGEDPSTYWTSIVLYSAVGFLFFIATDGFGLTPGLSGLFGWSEPVQDRPN